MPGESSPACEGINASLFILVTRCSCGRGGLAVVGLDVHGAAAAATDRTIVSGYRVSFPAMEVLNCRSRLILYYCSSQGAHRYPSELFARSG